MSISFKSNLPSDAELATLFGTVGTFEKYKVGDKVVTAGTNPIVKRARELAPRDLSGHGKKRSRAQQAKANWNMPLWKTITKKISRGNVKTIGVVGPKWPEGNKAYFNTGPNGRRVFYWGKDAGKIKVQIRNWIVQAADETRSEQLEAMKNKLQAEMENVIRG